MGKEVGVMHACGHDTHIAMLMGAAKILTDMKAEIKGTVKFIFQPAEEGAPPGEEGGAEVMLKEGVMENPKVDAIFGLHISSSTPVGEIRWGFVAWPSQRAPAAQWTSFDYPGRRALSLSGARWDGTARHDGDAGQARARTAGAHTAPLYAESQWRFVVMPWRERETWSATATASLPASKSAPGRAWPVRADTSVGRVTAPPRRSTKSMDRSPRRLLWKRESGQADSDRILRELTF